MGMKNRVCFLASVFCIVATARYEEDSPSDGTKLRQKYERILGSLGSKDCGSPKKHDCSEKQEHAQESCASGRVPVQHKPCQIDNKKAKECERVASEKKAEMAQNERVHEAEAIVHELEARRVQEEARYHAIKAELDRERAARLSAMQLPGGAGCGCPEQGRHKDLQGGKIDLSAGLCREKKRLMLKAKRKMRRLEFEMKKMRAKQRKMRRIKEELKKKKEQLREKEQKMQYERFMELKEMLARQRDTDKNREDIKIQPVVQNESPNQPQSDREQNLRLGEKDKEWIENKLRENLGQRDAANQTHRMPMDSMPPTRGCHASKMERFWPSLS